MPFLNGAKHTMLSAIAALIDDLSLHTDVPDATGSNEVTGGTYARQTPTWGTPASGAIPLAATFPVFDVPAGTTVEYVGLWEGSTFHGYMTPVGGPETFVSAGTLTLNANTKLQIEDPA